MFSAILKTTSSVHTHITLPSLSVCDAFTITNQQYGIEASITPTPAQFTHLIGG